MRKPFPKGIRVRRFYFHTRKNHIIYAELIDPVTGNKLSARSTGTTNRDEALMVVAGWLKEGIPTGRKRQPRSADVVFGTDLIRSAILKTDLSQDEAVEICELLRRKGLIDFTIIRTGGKAAEGVGPFLTRFWTFDESEYIAEKRALGHSIGKRHCYESLVRAKKYWVPTFENRRIGEITRQDLKSFAIELSLKKLSPATINKILDVGTTALRWLFQNGYIPEDPSSGVKHFSGKSRKRGILSPAEAAKLFSLTWPDERARVGNLVAATTGLRAGEILAIRTEDIGTDRLFVRHSWSFADGLKSTKTGKERTAYLLPSVRKELLALSEKNPHNDGFIFYSTLPGKPMDIKVLQNGIHDMLIKLSIGDETDPEKIEKAAAEWKDRAVTFHSWRHFFSKMLADRLDSRVVQLGTGHATGSMLEHYANHRLEEDFTKLAAGAENAFGSIVDFQTQEV